jgi:hypothetical protein
MSITENEMKVMKALEVNYFSVTLGDWVWSNSVNDSKRPSGLKGKVLSGTVSSLCSKGMVEANGEKGEDACVRLTTAGIAALK